MKNTRFVLPHLGEVLFEDELVHYDGPVLFTVRSENGGRYLGFWADDTDNASVYWYSSISDKRYRELLRGEIEVRQPFIEQESILIAHRSHATAKYEWSAWRSSSELDQDGLPEAGYRFAADDFETALSAGFVETARVLAARSGRAVARLIFDFGADIHEGPAGAIANAILQAQNVIDAIAYSKTNNPKERGAIPSEITNQTMFALRPIRASSLGIELISVQETDFWHDSVAGQSLEKFFDLLHAGSNQEELREQFAPLVGRAVDSYRKLLRSLQKSGATIAVETGLPRPQGERRTLLSPEALREMVEAMAAVEQLKSVELTFQGTLVGYDSDSLNFHVRRLVDEEEFRGKTTGAAIEPAGRARINGQYTMKIIERLEYGAITDEPTSKFELIELSE